MKLPEKVQTFYANPAKGWRVPDDVFTALLGRPLPPQDFLPNEPLTITSCLGDFSRKPLGKVIYNLFQNMSRKNNPLSAEGDDETTALMVARMMAEMPIGKMLMFSNGAMNEEMIEGMVLFANGKIFKGLGKLNAGRKKTVRS
jgi:hypothetical protein